MSYTKRYSILSFAFSDLTSPKVFIGDATSLSVSLVTATTDSTYTIQGSNADGFASSIGEGTWSTMTTLTAQGIYGIQVGARWIRALNPASTSSATMTLAKNVVL